MQLTAKVFWFGTTLILTGAAEAQEPRAPRQARERQEQIVVAQKRTESLQSVPVSVSVMTGDRIDLAGIQSLFDVANEVSSLTVVQNTGPISTSFRLRRIGNEANIPNFEPAVGVFVDGAFRSRTGVSTGELFDIEQIEILKGPQTTLYGKNTTAGAVSILTKRPSDSFEMSGRISVGQIEGFDRTNLVRLDTAVSGPMTETLSARLSGTYFDHGHTMKNLFVPEDAQDMHRYSIRGQLSYSPTNQVDVRLILGRNVIGPANVSEFELDEGIAIAAANAAFGVPCSSNSSTDRAFCNNHAVVSDLETDDLTLVLDLNVNGLSLTSVTGYEDYDTMRYFDADQLDINVVDITDRQSSQSYSQEVRIASPAEGRFRWLSGIYYYRNEFERGDPVLPTIVLGTEAPYLQLPMGTAFGQPGDAGILTSTTRSEHVSVFGQASWSTTAKLVFTAGARWQREDKSSVILNGANHSTPTLITLVLAPSSANATLSRDTDGLSWDVAAQYQWSDGLMGYASVAKGFKSGGFNAGFSPTPGLGREFGDETVTSYEIGAKTMLASGRIRLNASLFQAEYDDYQSAGFVSLRFRVNNAERVDVSGLEADLQAFISDRLTVAASISNADARYGRYTGGACNFLQVPDNADGTACVLTGYTLPHAPKWKSWLNVEYARSAAIGTVYAGADWTWVDRHFTDATLDPRHIQGAYSLFNLRGGLRFGRFDVSLWLDNVTNETIILQDGPTNLFARDPAFARFLAKPRSYGVTWTANW